MRGSIEPAGAPPPVHDHPGVRRRASDASDRDQARIDALVGAARCGDQQAFERIVELTHSDTFTLALRLTGCAEDARDVTQEVYLRAYRGLGTFRGDARFSTWLYRITANVAATHLRRRRRHRHEPLGDEQALADLRAEADPELSASAAELCRRVAAAVDQLPPKLRAVVVLRDVYELPHDVVARELGISSSAAKVRLHRARNRLRVALFPDTSEVGSREV